MSSLSLVIPDMCICVFVYSCICAFVHLFICVFVYLCICDFESHWGSIVSWSNLMIPNMVLYLCVCLFVYLCFCDDESLLRSICVMVESDDPRYGGK